MLLLSWNMSFACSTSLPGALHECDDSRYQCGSFKLLYISAMTPLEADDLATAAHSCATHHCVRELAIVGSDLGSLDESTYNRFLLAVSFMKRLRVVRLQDCGLRPRQFLRLLVCVLSTPTMRGTAFDYRLDFESLCGAKRAKICESTSEVSLKNNSLSNKFFKYLAIGNDGSFQKSPLSGVVKLNLSGNAISDKSFHYLTVLFPCLKELHLSGCKGVTGAGFKDVFTSYFPKIELLNLDGTSLCHTAFFALGDVVRARHKNSLSSPLDVWFREVGDADESWRHLLDVCDKKSEHFKFTTKHDMQHFCGECTPRATLIHEVVDVTVYFNGFTPVRVVDHDVVSTTSTADFVKRTLDDLNAMSMLALDEAKHVKIRKTYREAFQGLADSGHLMMRMFTAETATMCKTKTYSGTFTSANALRMPSTYAPLIGKPCAGVALSFYITVCEDEAQTAKLGPARCRALSVHAPA